MYSIFQLVADPAGPGFDLEVPIEVTIGTIPYNNIQASFGMPANGLQREGKQYNGMQTIKYAYFFSMKIVPSII